MISLRTNIATSISPLIPANGISKVCPHCGKPIDHNPHDTFDFIERQIIVHSRRVTGVEWRRNVPPKAWEILMFLLRNIGQFRTTERVHTACFDENVDFGAVTVTVGMLRKLLSGTHYTIETKYGIGYRLLRVGSTNKAL